MVIREEPQCSECGREKRPGEEGWVHQPKPNPDNVSVRDEWYCPAHAKGKRPLI